MMKPFQDSDGTFHDHGRIMSQRAGHENDAHARRGNARTPSRWGVPPPGMSQHTPADVPPNAHTFMRKPRLPTNEFPARSTSSYIPDADEVRCTTLWHVFTNCLLDSKDSFTTHGSAAGALSRVQQEYWRRRWQRRINIATFCAAKRTHGVK